MIEESCYMSLHELAPLGTLFTGFTLALLLAFAKRPNKTANLFLSLALAVVVVYAGKLTALFLPASGPLLYFYTRQLIYPGRTFRWKDALHFCPLLIAFWLPGWLLLMSVVIYLFLAHRMIEKHYRQLKVVLMDRPRVAFRRLDITLALLGACCLLSIFNNLFSFAIAFMLMGLAAGIIIKTGNDVQPDIPTETLEAREKGRRLKEAVLAGRIYEDPELTLAMLAAQLKILPHDLSRIINQGLKKNFSDFINEFRVRDIVRKMQHPAYEHLTLLGIAYESGFNSKTTFNRVFREMTGKTPLEYKKSLKKEVPFDNMALRSHMPPLILRQEGLTNWAPVKIKRSFMISNYVKTGWRNFINNKVYSAINVLGLATGMAVAILIALWIWDEVTYDRSFTNHSRLVQVMSNSVNDEQSITTEPNICRPIAQELRSKYGADFKNVSMSTWAWSQSLGVGDKVITSHGPWVEENFPAMFSLDMLKGNIHALSDPSSILISTSIAKTLFGDADPMGKIIRLGTKDNFTVAGVFRDFPDNSTLSIAKFFLPWKKYVATNQWVSDAANDWFGRSWLCYAQLSDNIDLDKENEKVKNLVMAHRNKADGIENIYLYAMDKWHLYSEFKNGKPSGGPVQFVWLFSVIGVFVLLLACINFMNLSTARSEKRAKEVGIRKAIGSLRSQLIRQFLSESVLVAFVSFICAIILVVLLLPLFSTLAAKNMRLPWGSPVFWLCTLLFTFITGLLSGSYPALYLSKFEPIKVLKGTFRVGRYASLPRKVLVVAQFTFSIALIIGTIVVFKQIQFAKNRPVNYRKEGLITVYGIADLPANYDAIRNDMLATGVVDDFAGASDGTTELGAWRNGVNWEGKNPNTLPNFGFMLMTEDFGKTIGWQVKEGRDFSRDFATDSLSMILNEASVKQIGMKKAIVGQNIQFEGKNYRVIGVVKNIIQESPYKPVAPMIYVSSHIWIGIVSISIKKGMPVKDALAKIEKVVKKYNPSLPFNYVFNDEEYGKKFADEQRVGNLATFFTILAIFISCLGLFGLASFVAEQRKKEIGVRKVLGASTWQLWQMLSKEFALLVIISCFIAIPLAWMYLNNWLSQYDYRTSISPWVFVVSGVGALVITLSTVSFQAIKAALANPVKSLRIE